MKQAEMLHKRDAGYLNLLLFLLHLTLKWSLGYKRINWPSITKGKIINGFYNNFVWILWGRIYFYYFKPILEGNVNINSLRSPSLVHLLPILSVCFILPLFQIAHFETSIHRHWHHDITDSMRRKIITAVCTRQHKTRAAKTQSKLH